MLMQGKIYIGRIIFTYIKIYSTREEEDDNT